MKEIVLGIDVGTSSIKVALIDRNGKFLSRASQKVSIQRRKAAWAEQDMNEVWNAVASCIRSCLSSSPVGADGVAAVCCSGQGNGAWMLDTDGKPLGPAILWNDNRASEIIRSWEASGLLQDVYRKTATVLWPGSMAGIMAWFRDNSPDMLDSLGTVFCCKDWINYCLTGEIVTDRTDGSIPFTNMRESRIDNTILSELGLDFLNNKLPNAVEPTYVVGTIQRAAAEATGLTAGTPVVTGLLDVTANAIGAGAIEAGQALMILGTTLILAVILDTAPYDERNVGATVLHAVDGQWLRVFGAQSGTPNVDWMAGAFGLMGGPGKTVPDFKEIDRLCASSPPGSNGVLYHPFLSGERAPFLDPYATSGFFGISATTTSADLCRSVYEGVALSAKHCISAMDSNVRKIAMTGGGTRNALWCRIFADATGCEISVPEGEELGILGAAIVGSVGIGLHRSYREAVSRMVTEKEQYRANPVNSQRYNELFPLYIELVEAMKGYWKKRAAVLRRWKDV